MEHLDTKQKNGRPPQKAAMRWARRWSLALWAGAWGLLLVAVLGFVSFADGLPRDEPAIAESADGIVVLTGGASRIVDAIDLLAAQRGKRLLISGVHPATTPDELTRINPDLEELIYCCVDLGHEATNTIGNAVETAHWVRDKKFRSLIVVTSGWHMPRALLEIERELPDVRLIPYPVVTDRMRAGSWWFDPPTVRILLIEYAKYLASVVHVRFDYARGGGAHEPRS